MRSKRSVDDYANKTDGVTFYHTTDELNEGSLHLDFNVDV